MYKDVLRSISDVSLYPVVAILIFFAFFVALIVYVLRMDKTQVRDMASIPVLDEPVVTGHPSTPNTQIR
ncbi:MAG: hypothetical protein SF053_17285 [Bacteroidia bacterium]|jgi:cytochrome c oxidase cbb3-type subunit 3|nr:hypothetical protein [Bacteroidia bacterium]